MLANRSFSACRDRAAGVGRQATRGRRCGSRSRPICVVGTSGRAKATFLVLDDTSLAGMTGPLAVIAGSDRRALVVEAPILPPNAHVCGR
jgi:hypothetical protein